MERILDVEKKPRIAGNVDHNYIDKYELVNVTANTAIIAYMNVLERFGLTTDVLKSIDKSKPTTIRFEASTKLEFLKEVVVDVPMNWSYMEEEESKSPGKVANVSLFFFLTKFSSQYFLLTFCSIHGLYHVKTKSSI